MRRLHLIILSLFVVSCSSSMKVDILSDPPQATVYLKSKKKMKKLGQTPLNLDSNKLRGDKGFHFVIAKEGYRPENVLIEKRSFPAQGEIFTKLEPFSVSTGNSGGSRGNFTGKVQKISRTVASIQSQILQKNFQQAEVIARDLINEYPYFAVAWNLLGNAYYLQRKHKEALQAYYKALEFEPENKETKQLIDRIERVPERGDR